MAHHLSAGASGQYIHRALSSHFSFCFSWTDIPAVAGGEFQEMASKCNMFLDPTGFSSEDISSPFNIPRTSSIAKAKRPSVSFAEGTRFSPKERRGSTQDPSALPGHPRTKPKPTWGILMVSALQNQGGAAKTRDEDGGEGEDVVDVQETNNQESVYEGGEQDLDRNSTTPSCATQRPTRTNAAHKGSHVPACTTETQTGVVNKVTTVYVTVGKAGRPVSRAESSSEGPVQAMLRRLGSLQRQKEQESGRTKVKGAEGITKPPRRKLGARASAWEQGEPSGGETGICKPIRRKHVHQNSPTDTVGGNDAAASESNTPKRPLSSILKSVPEVASTGDEQSTGQTESNYLTVGPAGDAVSLTEVITNQGAVVSVNDEPCYENVILKH